MTPLLRAPQYPTTSTSFWLHSPLHAAAMQSTRITRSMSSARLESQEDLLDPEDQLGRGGPAGPASPFSPTDPTAPGSPFGPSQPATQMESAIATAILLICMHVPLFHRCPKPRLLVFGCPDKTQTRADGTRQDHPRGVTAGLSWNVRPRPSGQLLLAHGECQASYAHPAADVNGDGVGDFGPGHFLFLQPDPRPTAFVALTRLRKYPRGHDHDQADSDEEAPPQPAATLLAAPPLGFCCAQ